MLGLSDHLSCVELRVCEDFLETANRPAGHSSLVQLLNPLLPGVPAHTLREDRSELVVAHHALPVGFEPLVAIESSHRAETAPLVVVADCQDEVAVRRRERFVRN